MLSYSQVQNSTVANVASCDVNSPAFASLVNEACQILIDLGEWWGTVHAFRGQVFGHRIIWPGGVDAVLAMNDRGRNLQVANYWYEFLNDTGCFSHRFAGFDHNNFDRNHHGIMRFSGTVPMFAGPTLANPFQIQVTADNSTDYGKAITIYGLDTNGQEVYSTQPNGSTTSVQRGVRLVLAAASTYTTQVFSHVTHVTKDITVGCVRAWQYFPNAGTGYLIANYTGSQTSPEFLYSDLMGSPLSHRHEFEALVKLSFTPVSQPSDILCIDNLAAIKQMVQCIKKRETSDVDADTEADKFELTAIRRLNAQLRTRVPDEQFKAVQWGINPQRRRVF